MLRLRILAYHVQEIATRPAGETLDLSPCQGINVKVRIEKATSTDDPAWDQVFINGRWCGNRHGGIREFIELVNELKPEINWDDEVTAERQRARKALADREQERQETIKRYFARSYRN